MKLATWNVNLLNVRAPQVIDWLKTEQPDVLCLQDTKIQDHKFPYDELSQIGYHAVHLGQKTYNGVAIISRYAIEDVQFDMPDFEDEQKHLFSCLFLSSRPLYGPHLTCSSFLAHL